MGGCCTKGEALVTTSASVYALNHQVAYLLEVSGYQHRQRGGFHHRGRGNRGGGGHLKEPPGHRPGNPKMSTVPLANPPPPLVSKISPHFDNSTPSQVSWIRRTVEGGLNVLTVGTFAYTMDQRFQVVHFDNSESWALHIKYPSLDDSGVYECQVSTTPKISRFVRLDVVESRASIIGGPSLYVNGGSVLRLICLVDGVAEGPTSTSPSSSATLQTPTSSTSGDTEFVFWFRNGKLLNYDQDLRQRVSLSAPTVNAPQGSLARTASSIRPVTERVVEKGLNGRKDHNKVIAKKRTQRRLESRLEISSVGAADSGNYSCQPSNSAPDVIQVFVIVSECLT
ncbi:hypothetical protein BIW11_08439 [Tropilaelaps mercedesae]|uniref:Ig-like domain-containing protein n=1 Tax=Tropilaelaps mercedesae TaxID=418985 RepID=A0A1V9XPJ8_9ACAR|nr:hypothetical protein BIW11_08439 [Tropilaelaps mercedesae]